MTTQEEAEMHALAVRLEELTRGDGWEAMRYMAIGQTMEKLSEYAPPCACFAKKNRLKARLAR